MVSICLRVRVCAPLCVTFSASSLVFAGVILSAMLSVILTLCFMHSVSAFMYCLALMNRWTAFSY